MALAAFFRVAQRQQIRIFAEENGREPNATEVEEIKAFTLSNVRGTVQADQLKEAMGQNTLVFNLDTSLRMMGDVAEFYVNNSIRNHYFVSISGYHIAEAGANPITQAALTWLMASHTSNYSRQEVSTLISSYEISLVLLKWHGPRICRNW